MEDLDILKVLFEEHHRQLSETRQKTQNLTHRVVGILLLATGWLLLSQEPLTCPLRWLFIITLASVAVTACFTLIRFNSNYRRISKVIARLNVAFGLFEKDRYLKDESIYPDSWKSFGSEWILGGIIHHLLIIVSITIMAIITAVIR